MMVHRSGRPGETALDAALRIVRKPDFGVLPIQGPPGSGKTYTGGRLICELVRNGARVGITANSHKVIVNLLAATMEAADEQGIELRAVRKPGGSDNEPDDSKIIKATTYPKFFGNLAGDCKIGAGTAWLWSRPEAENTGGCPVRGRGRPDVSGQRAGNISRRAECGAAG